MSFAEKILLKFCKNDASTAAAAYREEWNEETALLLLKRVYPEFLSLIKGKVVCDFGCGAGYQAVALVKNGARKVVGIESNPDRLEFARQVAVRHGVVDRIELHLQVDEALKGSCDVVISQNSMEHFSDPGMILGLMKSLLGQEGVILVSFGPPWYAPYGSHMQFFTNLPWVNILFSEKTVMNVRRRYRSDGASRYEDVESGLNKMSVAKFERLVRESGLRIVYKNYECVKGWNALAKLPLVRELFINHITCSLVR